MSRAMSRRIAMSQQHVMPPPRAPSKELAISCRIKRFRTIAQDNSSSTTSSTNFVHGGTRHRFASSTSRAVATVVKRIAEQFAAESAELEHQWDRGDNVSTEDLRQALRRYRSFFDRLLAF